MFYFFFVNYVDLINFNQSLYYSFLFVLYKVGGIVSRIHPDDLPYYIQNVKDSWGKSVRIHIIMVLLLFFASM